MLYLLNPVAVFDPRVNYANAVLKKRRQVSTCYVAILVYCGGENLTPVFS
jgi:hypothetical protein